MVYEYHTSNWKGHAVSVDTYRVKKPKILDRSNTGINDRATMARLMRAEVKWLERTKDAHDAYVGESLTRMGLRSRHLLQVEQARTDVLGVADVLELGRIFDGAEARS